MVKRSGILIATAISASLFLSACTSRPSEEELRQLNDLKAEVSALEKQVPDKEKEKAKLEKEVAEKNGKLQECQDDQAAVRKALGQ
ncbi:MAG: hypothetical protein IGBAC_2165 [Ignavibacteriae bacterium]|nr:MAG: hypothetical protein IGBAC_2165 [Ignavibacteriota bacterium]